VQLAQDTDLRDYMATRKQQGELVALGSHCLILEDGPKITNLGAEQEDHREEITEGPSRRAQGIIGRAGGPDTGSRAGRE
jgi:hypothetical protein